jgi:LAGLIDADG-like domain
MNKGKKLLGDLKFYESYSKSYQLEENWIKETWEESCTNVMQMHYNKFKGNKKLLPFLHFAQDMYINKRVLASQRNLQYREEQITQHNHRIFNCSSTYIDRPEVFGEALYVLLGGCGVGYSVEQRFINKLPLLKKRKEKVITHVIEDSIEGWGIALDKLMQSFFKGSETIRFDGSNIRKEGSFISGGFKAPGYEPLKKSLEQIEAILENKINNNDFKLSSLDCHEIICISSDSVLAAGVRRSALIVLFDKEDMLMLNCKTGNWYYDKPWLARANNSIKLLKGKFTQEEFNSYKESIKQFGEPGIVLVDDIDWTTNPCCFTKDVKILSPTGYINIGNNIGDLDLINQKGEIVNGSIWSNGQKEVVELSLSNNTKIKCTPEHRFMDNTENEVLAENSLGLRLMPFYNINREINEFVKYGFIQGDGGLGRLLSETHKGLEVNFGEKDDDVLDLFEIVKINDKRTYYLNDYNEILKSLQFDSNSLPLRDFPKTYLFWETNDKLMFLKGMYSANGCIIKNQRISYKTTCKKLAQELQDTLSFFNISAYITTNKEKDVLFKNGNYTCKQSYDINISKYDSVLLFASKIGFVHLYKQESLKDLILSKAPKVLNIKNVGIEEVFDFSLNDDKHWGVVEGVIAHNCEIGFIPINPKTDKSCWSFCNLNEINGSLCNTEEDFYNACKAAAILGTLQSSYTNIPFLGKETKELIEWEALLGVSITGFMDNPKILFNPEILQKGAQIVKDINKEIAEIIGINQSARVTCTKPSGNASVLLGTSSGIHPAHSKTYLRIMQMNKNGEVAKMLEKENDCLLENSAWSASGNDFAVHIPIEENPDSITKDEITDIQFLEYVKLVYENWVLPGTNLELGYSSRVKHNVSNTVTINNWDNVFDYIFTNQNSFCGLSFMAELGDKVYKQAPFTKVMSFKELSENYGEASIFASGLIVDSLHAFDSDLWDACEAAKNKEFKLSGDRYSVLLKKEVVRRIKKFAKNYFKNNIDKTIDCLKNIHIFHKYNSIKREFKEIDFTKVNFTPSFTNANEMGALACSSGGSCEITRI